MINKTLLGLVETVLGKGIPKSKGNYAFKCINPSCKSHSHPIKNIKLEVNLIPQKISHNKIENKWACWVCGIKGKTIHSLFKRIKVNIDKYSQLNQILGTTQTTSKYENYKDNNVSLPKEFKPFLNLKKSDLIGRNALIYLLKTRGISFNDIIKHNIGYCETGKYANKIIIPSYSDEGNVEYFVARSFIKDDPHPMDAPSSDKNIIGFESLINWNLPIIICEGPMDAIAIKRNAIPLFGKNISNKLEKKLISDEVKDIYISLDEDALKNTLSLSEKLLNLNKNLYVIRNESDPSATGFEKFTNSLYDVSKFTYKDLFKLKMEYEKI